MGRLIEEAPPDTPDPTTMVPPPTDPAMTRSSSSIAKEISDRAAATEPAKKQDEIWYQKFLTGMPELYDELTNYPTWMYSVKDI